MLLQSHEGFINLLPSLPKEWIYGNITGLLARGCFEVSIKIENNELKEAKIKSLKGNSLQILDKNYDVYCKSKVLRRENYIYIDTEAGEEIVIKKAID